MMAKRFTKRTVNWLEIEKRVPPEQKSNFYVFKGKSDVYWQRVLANPAEMPTINWETYRKLIPDKKIVDDLKSDLEKYKVPYPEDTLTPKIEEQWKALQPEIEKFCAEQDKEIEKATKELNRVKALPKFEDMTMEMFYDFYPDEALDPVNRPTFWPHNPEEQPGYQTPEQKTMKKGCGH